MVAIRYCLSFLPLSFPRRRESRDKLQQVYGLYRIQKTKDLDSASSAE